MSEENNDGVTVKRSAEPLAAILAEMRKQANEPTIESLGEIIQPVGVWDVLDWADRIEAAAKREREAAQSARDTKDAMDYAATAESRSFVGVDLAKDKPTFVCATISPVNAAALRDVVESLCEISPNDEVELSKLSKRLIADDIYGGGLVEKIVRDIAKARAALAAPARNCDRFGGDENKLIEACLNERGLLVTENFRYVFSDWLLAPAKGGAV